jgi:hypothetical protein
MLIAGSLGVSSLISLLNNGDRGRKETTANLLGPFWRDAYRRRVSASSAITRGCCIRNGSARGDSPAIFLFLL